MKMLLEREISTSIGKTCTVKQRSPIRGRARGGGFAPAAPVRCSRRERDILVLGAYGNNCEVESHNISMSTCSNTCLLACRSA